MLKLTKSLPVIKERNCSASLVLDTRTNRKNASEYPLTIRFTVDHKLKKAANLTLTACFHRGPARA